MKSDFYSIKQIYKLIGKIYRKSKYKTKNIFIKITI